MKDLVNKVNFDDKGLVPVVVQSDQTQEVLMLAYMNKEALVKTIEEKIAHYYSRKRKTLWKKGETSGHYQYVKSIGLDCDQDTVLLKVEQEGVACHTLNSSCFFDMHQTQQEKQLESSKVIEELYAVIKNRQLNPIEGSYTTYLFSKGLDKILKKVGEETSEVIIGAKNNAIDEVVYESSDLIYHLLVLLVNQGISLNLIFEELRKRRK